MAYVYRIVGERCRRRRKGRSGESCSLVELDPLPFTVKYPKAHIVIGRFDPGFAIDEEATGEPSLFAVLTTARNTLNPITHC